MERNKKSGSHCEFETNGRHRMGICTKFEHWNSIEFLC